MLEEVHDPLLALWLRPRLETRGARWTSHFLVGLRGEFSVASQVLLSSDAAAVGLCVRQMCCSNGTRELASGTK